MEIAWLGHSCFRIKGKEVVLVGDAAQVSKVPEAITAGFDAGNAL